MYTEVITNVGSGWTMGSNSDLNLLSDVLERHDEASELLGLFLTPALKPSGYDATPACCRTFAWTGGDGVHFSFADLGEMGTPVVMTVPMNFDAPNMVIGSELRDFLALGLRTGYFMLEQLVYNSEAALAQLTGGINQASAVRAALEDIRETFALVPWTDVQTRLDTLQVKYARALI
jgi:hypothetical protein